LGLYICKQLVTRQGGAIWLDSTPGRGSTFSFTLPVFDLTHLIAPLLKHDRWPRETAALVEVRTSEIRGESAVQPGLAWCQQVAGVVQGCLMPNLDVLLPPVRRDGVVQFFAAAFADEHGARVLTRRIREQLDRHQAVTPTGTTTSVSYQMLPPVALDGDADMEAIVGAMVGVIEASIQPVLADDVSRSRCAATAVVPRTLRDTASPPQGEIVGTEQPPPALSGGGA
jgi:CBS domain-containing protein